MRVTMKAVVNAVSAAHTGVQPRATNKRLLKVIIAPKPRLLSDNPNPGSNTAPSTVTSGGWLRGSGGTARSKRMNGTTASGTTAVVTAIAKNSSDLVSPFAGPQEFLSQHSFGTSWEFLE